MLDWIAKHRINEYSDVLGLLVTIVGFGLALYNIRRSRLVASQALAVAKSVREDIFKSDTIAELSAALIAMETIKNYARLQAFGQMQDRLADVKHRLAGIRTTSSMLSSDDKAILQGAIAQFSLLEAKIDRALEAGSAPTGWARDNSVLSTHIDRVHSVLSALRTSSGEGQ